jgi:hypothetical protein
MALPLFHVYGPLLNYGAVHEDYRDPNEVTATVSKAESCPTPLLPEAMTRLKRKSVPIFRARYSVFIWSQQLVAGKPMLPACTWCGLPTGYWCDDCEKKGIRPMRAICNRCEAEEHKCKPCARGLGRAHSEFNFKNRCSCHVKR